MRTSCTYDITAFGAIGDGKTLASQAIQAALDAAHAAGGGVVFVPPGTFRSGTICLRSGVVLDLSPKAVLKGSDDIADYRWHETGVNPDGNVDLQPYHFIVVDGIERSGIRGGGTIDGSGPAFWSPPETSEFFVRKDRRPSPMLEIRGTRDFRMEHVSVVDSPGWTIHVNDSENIRIEGVDIRNNLRGPNTDGIDVTDSRDVFISNCNLVCGDDAIVLKSLGGINERIVVTNCILQTNCSALKLGASESFGTIRQVSMSNCVIRESARGISLYCLAGGTFEDVAFSTIVMDCHTAMPLVCPIHINLSRAPEPGRDRGIGRICNVRISDVHVRTKARILLTAEPGSMLENIALRGIHMSYPAVENRFEQARAVVGGQFSPFSPNARGAPAVIVAENIAGLSVRDVTAGWPAGCEVPMHAFWARNVQGGIYDCPLLTPSQAGVERIDVQDSEMTVR